MLTEENPEALASPEQKHEVDSKNKKPRTKKKNSENLAQSNEHPHPQVCSEPLVVVPNPEIKSNVESSLPKKKKRHKKKDSINVEVAPVEVSKPSLDLEIRKEAEPVEVSVKGAETVIGKRKRKSEIGKLDEVVVVENALKHDHDQEQLNTVDTEEKLDKKHKSKRNKSEVDVSQSNELNIKPAETAVRTSIVDREVPPADPTIPGNARPVNLSELENEYVDRKWMQKERRREHISKREGKTKESNGKAIEIQAQRPIDPITEPSTDLAIIMDPRPATPVDAEQKIAKKHRKKKTKCETPAQKSTISTTTPSTVSTDQVISINPACHAAAPPIVAAIPEQKTSKKKRKRKGGLKSEELESDRRDTGSTAETSVDAEQKIAKKHRKKKTKCETPAQKSTISTTTPSTVSIDQAISINPACHAATPPIVVAIREGGLKSEELESDRRDTGSTAETSVRGTERVKVTNAPHYQHGISSRICWACRETNHTIQQCQKLKYLSKDEEVCFFCGEIGHSLGKCSVYKAGGGRLARCLFCDAHGHFSYNCPGNVHDPKVQWPVEAERKIQC